MSQSKNKNETKFNDWKEQQQKYAQTAKEMFEKFTVSAPKAPKIDFEAVMAGNKKNMEALSDANKMAVEVLKSISQLQSQFVRQTFDDFNKLMQGVMAQKPGSPMDFSAPTECMKNTISKAVEHAGKVGEVLKNSGGQIHAHMKGCMEENVNGMKEHMSKYSKH